MKESIDSILISPYDSIKKAMKVIDKSGLRSALVVDEKRCLVGIVTDGDIRTNILKDINLNLSIRVIMNTHPIVLKQGYLLKEAKELMIKNSITLIPVVDQNNAVIDYLHLPDMISQMEKSGEIQRVKKKTHEIKKVLVIGGAGYIGSVLVRRLMDSGYKVRVLDILLYGDESIKGLYSEDNFEFIYGDCRNTQDVIQGLEGVDAVVHLGEIVGDLACSLNPDFTIQVNYMATKTLAELCCHYGIQRFVFSSSCSVYGINDSELNETSELNPISLYARCKVESEKAILSIKDSYFSPVVLRLATVYGFSYRPRFDLVINLLTAKAVTEKKIEIHGGQQWRPFVATVDVADAIISALRADDDSVSREIFNVGSDNQNYQLSEVGKLIKQVVPDVNIEVKTDVSDRRNYKVRFSKIKNSLGFTCKRKVLDEVIRIKDFISKSEGINIKDPKFSNYGTFVNAENS